MAEALRDAFSRLRVLVVGDVMLDEYWFGDVKRISPEAPVPIVKVTRSDVRPGGAANVARNIVALGAQCSLLSVVGADDTADKLRSALSASGVAHHLEVDQSIRTTLKLRVIGQQQQMIRVDFEEPPSAEILHAKKQSFAKLVAEADLIVFSDYNKGVLRDVADLIAIVKAAGKPMFVDPKGRDYHRYARATILTPNRSELYEAVGGWTDENEMDAKAEALRVQLNLDALLLTMSEQGMKLYLPDRIIHRPAQAQEVFDVSGAGDTVIAALSVMRGAGQSWEEAIAFANAAAGVAVGKLGTSVVSLAEVTQFQARSAPAAHA